jgi:hypothetical protein
MPLRAGDSVLGIVTGKDGVGNTGDYRRPQGLSNQKITYNRTPRTRASLIVSSPPGFATY